jgi:2-keto-3-deoxy-L-rhamnonate aldolase RhmA
MVRACYFGPLGERSFGANRGTDYNAGIADKAAYYREANEQMLVCALLEDVAVLENLNAILSVPGIDLYSELAGVRLRGDVRAQYAHDATIEIAQDG